MNGILGYIFVLTISYLISILLLALIYQIFNLEEYERNSKKVGLLFRVSLIIAPLTFSIVLLWIILKGIFVMIITFFKWLFYKE